MEKNFENIENQVDEIYDGFYEDYKQMLFKAEEINIPSKVLLKQPIHETNPNDSDGRERILFRFTAHKDEEIADCKDDLEKLQKIFQNDTRFTTWSSGLTYCLGVFSDE